MTVTLWRTDVAGTEGAFVDEDALDCHAGVYAPETEGVGVLG